MATISVQTPDGQFPVEAERFQLVYVHPMVGLPVNGRIGKLSERAGTFTTPDGWAIFHYPLEATYDDVAECALFLSSTLLDYPGMDNQESPEYAAWVKRHARYFTTWHNYLWDRGLHPSQYRDNPYDTETNNDAR